MSINPEYDGTVTLRPYPNGAESEPAAVTANQAPPAGPPELATHFAPAAPISPGTSGGPVVDGQGRVVAVAAAKFEGTGVEALSLAIPVQTVCTALVTCDRSPGG